MEISQKHIFLSSSSDIDTISQPLKNRLGLTSFVYHCNFNDGSEIHLSNQPHWIEYFYNKDYYKSSVFEYHPKKYRHGFVLWSQLKNHSVVLQGARDHDIDHGITLIVPQKDSCEFYFFGTTRDNSTIVPFYMNNLDLLQNYVLFFKEKAFHILQQAKKQKIIILNKYEKSDNFFDPSIQSINSKIRFQFLKDIQLRKLPLENGDYLSSREILCAQHILLGYNMREIADLLVISPRTVETHISHIKDKLGCTKKSELCNMLRKYFPS